MNPIEEFYKDSTILVSGPNGFLGSVLVEKLLRCFDVKKVFLLIRAKNNESIKERMENFLNRDNFHDLRGSNPELFEKLEPVEVDYSCSDLNIDSNTLQQMKEEVQIVFNVVASVKFNELLHDAIEINLLGTKKIVNLVHGFEKLKSFVHVSTLYSNCNRREIDEKIYDHTLNYHQLVTVSKLLKDMKTKERKEMEKLLFNDFPNTYTLTKHFAEKLVYHQAYFLPTGIFRPPLVMSSYKDCPGFTDNINGPTGIIAWTCRGYLHVIYGDKKLRSNFVPVDYCINALLVCAWDIHDKFQDRIRICSKIPIYNYISHENNLTWERYMKLVPLGFKMPLEKSLWYYSYLIIPSKIPFKFFNFIFHMVPAILMDLSNAVLGKNMKYRRAYKKTEKILMIMSYFGLRQWDFKFKNIERLIDETKHFKFDRGHLDFDLKTIDWSEFFKNYIPGIKKYYFRENCENVEKLRVSYDRMKKLHNLLKFLLYGFLSRNIFKAFCALLSKIAFKMINN